jgi:predicted dienelactone hydrolase
MQSLWCGCLSGCSFAIGLVSPSAAPAAEKVHASYGFIELTILVKDLEIYANSGRLSPALQAYAKYFKPNQLQELRGALTKRIELPSQAVSQFLYTPTGEKLLERASELITDKSKGASVQALRSAMILSAYDSQGLTVLNMLQKYPDEGIQLDVAQGLEVFQNIRTLVQQTNGAIALVDRQAELAAKSEKANPDRDVRVQDLVALRKAGTYAWDVFSLSLVDKRPQRIALSGKAREYLADVYLPRLGNSRPQPVVVISHGLGSGRTSFRYFAEHLASYGYVVAVPEHPGSSDRQFEALLNSKVSDVSEPTEFLDRPADVSYLLDELERLNQTDPRFQGHLNLSQVGVMGQSFGGYTALALVGAKFDLARVQRNCESNLSKSLNLSLLLQCQVQKLPQKAYTLQDSRVKAAIAVNPIGATVFGPSGFKSINKPVMIVSGSSDAIAPILAEQIEPFSWLPSIEKRMILIDGATHFSMIDETQSSERAFITPKELIGRAPEIAKLYMRAMGLAFFQTYVKQQPKASVFLTPASVQAQSIQPLEVRGITSLSAKALERGKAEP